MVDPDVLRKRMRAEAKTFVKAHYGIESVVLELEIENAMMRAAVVVLELMTKDEQEARKKLEEL